MKSTKKRFISSVLALIMCVCMLVGTTFAWFTDSVTSGTNRIVAGNLDVELYYKNGAHTDWTDASEASTSDPKFFTKIGATTDDVLLWEPGVMSYVNFEVRNVGNLALKYVLTTYDLYKNFVKEKDGTVTDKSLLDVIKFALVDSEKTYASREAVLADLEENNISFTTLDTFNVAGELLPKENKAVTLIAYWAPNDNDTDNIYNLNNGKSASDDYMIGNEPALRIEFDAKLVATQLEHEADSFDIHYDKDAFLPADFPTMTEKFPENSTESLEVKKVGVIEEAKVPAAAANAVFDDLSSQAPASFKDGSGNLKNTVSQELVLTLDVEDKGAHSNQQTFNIDMTAVMTFTEGDNTETVTKNVTNLSDFVYVDVQVAKGLVVDGVKHNDKDMKNAATPDGTNDDNGYFDYNSTTGILRLIMKSFSPFTMTWQELQAVTPTSKPVSGTIDGTQGSFNNGKYETVLATSGGTKGLYYLDVVFNNANPGDILYLTFDETPTVGEDVGSPNEYKTYIVIDGTNITPTDKTAKIVLNQGESHILNIMQNKANKVSIKIDHQELPVIVAQPTAANPMVAATGEDLHYQWCKENSTVVDNDTQKAVYAVGTKDELFNTVYSETKFEDNKWKCHSIDTLPALVIILHNVSAGDIVSFNAESATGTKVTLSSVDGNKEFYKLEQNASSYSVEIPEGVNGSCSLRVGFTGEDFAGTVSIQKLTPIANGTGPKLETTEPGTYFCKVSNRVGAVISDKVTIN